MARKFSGALIDSSGPVVLYEGESKEVWVEFQNTGTMPWNENTRIGTFHEKDRTSQLCDKSWLFCSRPTCAKQAVPTTEIYRFSFIIKAPLYPVDAVEYFTLVQEGDRWNENPHGVWELKVKVLSRHEISSEETKKPKLLYLSSHQELEANEVTTFRNLGFEVFPVGFYAFGSHETDNTLRVIPGKNHPSLLAKFKYYHPGFQPGPLKLNEDFIRDFDIVVNTHFVENLNLNWNRGFKNKFVVHRTIGQGSADFERNIGQYMDRVPVVRISAAEKLMHGYCGQTALIRTTVDDQFFSGWNGEKEQVLTVQKWMARGGGGRMLPEYIRITNPFDGKRILAGRENQKLPFGLGDVPNDELQKLRQDSRVYFSVASRYAPLTYSLVEAMMTGMPVVVVGMKLAAYTWYEPPNFIVNGENGFCCDTEEECTQHIQMLMNDPVLGKKIGEGARKTAQQMFSSTIIEEQWRTFFRGYGF